jgi:hypothetical protein
MKGNNTITIINMQTNEVSYDLLKHFVLTFQPLWHKIEVQWDINSETGLRRQ